jgi:hypothetical protein
MVSEWSIGKDVEGSGRGRALPAFAWEDWGKLRSISVRIAGLEAEIWTRDFQNTKQEF